MIGDSLKSIIQFQTDTLHKIWDCLPEILKESVEFGLTKKDPYSFAIDIKHSIWMRDISEEILKYEGASRFFPFNKF